MKQLPISLEFFPPKTPEGVEKLAGVRQKLYALQPEFCSVTYGAGGSTQQGTFDTVKADWARYAALHQRVKQLQDSDQLAAAQQVFMSEGIPLYLNLTKSVSDLIRINHGYAKASRKVVVAAYDSAK